MKTAVEWLIDELGLHCTTDHEDEIQEALKKESEQKKQLVIFFYIDLKMKNNKLPYGMKYLNKLSKLEEEAEEYYNKTFKQSNLPEFPEGSKQQAL
jgi:hypothetical protein